MVSGDGDPALRGEQSAEPIRVFISYRRSDDSNFIGRFHDRLVGVFGADHVFRDIDSIPAGARFADVIAQRLGMVDVVVAMIGPTWAAGDRLHGESDFVRMEIASALAMGKAVIPVLIEDTTLPTPTSLPDDLRALLELNVVRVRRDPDFHNDARRALDGIVRSVELHRDRIAEESRRAREAEERRRQAELDEREARERSEAAMRRRQLEAELAAAAAEEDELRRDAESVERERLQHAALVARMEWEATARQLAEERARLDAIEHEKRRHDARLAAASERLQHLRQMMQPPDDVVKGVSLPQPPPLGRVEGAIGVGNGEKATGRDAPGTRASPPAASAGPADAENRSQAEKPFSQQRSIRLAIVSVIGGVLLTALILALSTRQPDQGTDTDRSATTTAGAAPTSAAASAGPTPSITTDAAPSLSTTPNLAPSGDPAMSLTIQLDPAAVWDDGTPITISDFQCTLDATINTPGSSSTVGYEKIASIEPGASDQEIVVSFSEVYAPYKTLFASLIKADAVEDCNDVSADMIDNLPFSGSEWKVDSWSSDQLTLVPNETYWGPEKPIAATVVMLPQADSDIEIASLRSGESDFILPQAYPGITDALNDPNIQYTPAHGMYYEGLYFQQRDGVFADDDFRQAFAKSIDRDLILAQIYDPIFPGGSLLNCGLWVPTIGEWCDDSVFADFYDPAGAERILTDAGWTKGSDGFWADPEGNVPEIRWIVNSGNFRRESTQALMIPELAVAGFKIVTDNCDAACYIEQRLPALDYDLAMYINTAPPEPTVTAFMHCDSVPSEENGNQGQNSTGWCNEDASALMTESDQTMDATARTGLIHQIAQYLADDAVMLPLYQFPNIAAWRTDKLSGPIDSDAGNYRAFQNIWEWAPASGDQIVIGAEQWPECLNPITECANLIWYWWTVGFKVLPSVWTTTNTGTFEPSALVTGEPTVVVHR